LRLKLFWQLGLGYLLLLLLALAVVYGYTVRVLERNILESTFSHLDALIRVAATRPPEIDDIEALQEWTEWMAQSGARVTVIAHDGLVLADSYEEPRAMENHAQRPEIRGAFLNGRGRATRFSNTLKTELVYLAVRYDWGPSPPIALRLAQPHVQVRAAIAEVRRPMVSVSLFVLLIGGGLSLVFSRSRLDMDGDAMKGRHLVEITRHNEILTMVESVLVKGERMESEITTPGPDSRDLLDRAAPVGERGAVLVLLDITDIRKLERVRRDFVANVSHELRTPLTAIQGFAETLLSGALDEPENSRRFVTIIRDHATRLGRLTEDLLKLSRIEAGKVEIELRSVATRDIVDQCVETSKLKSNEKQQTLEIEWPDETPEALADPNALLEVLQNLVDNAVQYTPEGRRIIVRGAFNQDETCILVIDDGIGISEAYHDRIFERFYRVDAARSRSVGGTGLGLAIARHLVDLMHGRIELESRLGQGSVFTVFLPRSDKPSS